MAAIACCEEGGSRGAKILARDGAKTFSGFHFSSICSGTFGYADLAERLAQARRDGKVDPEKIATVALGTLGFRIARKVESVLGGPKPVSHSHQTLFLEHTVEMPALLFSNVTMPS